MWHEAERVSMASSRARRGQQLHDFSSSSTSERKGSSKPGDATPLSVVSESHSRGGSSNQPDITQRRILATKQVQVSSTRQDAHLIVHCRQQVPDEVVKYQLREGGQEGHDTRGALQQMSPAALGSEMMRLYCYGGMRGRTGRPAPRPAASSKQALNSQRQTHIAQNGSQLAARRGVVAGRLYCVARGGAIVTGSPDTCRRDGASKRPGASVGCHSGL